jgi:hypothetical protein
MPTPFTMFFIAEGGRNKICSHPFIAQNREKIKLLSEAVWYPSCAVATTL